MAKDRNKQKKKGKTKAGQQFLAFSKKNYVVLLIAIAVITVGYILLSKNDITLAPILLVLGYCVLIPIAIILR